MLSQESIEKAESMVAAALGEGFTVDGRSIPRSVGVQGDARVYAGAVFISGGEDDLKRLLADSDKQLRLGETAGKLIGEISDACRVVIDITPGLPDGGLPLSEPEL